MCLAIPGIVKKIDGMKLLVQYPEEERQVLDGGVPVEVGDYVLIQMGIVVKKLTRKEAEAASRAWK
ncbi:MAG: HypC/HybG/HupF family hydrogenase formation chaperone [Patescibacteria group bacterium]|jgi:hydrogenase maturation factor